MHSAINKIKVRIEGRIRRATNRAGKYLHARMVENASLTDHTLKQLADMGHPYSKRQPQSIHTPNWLVHKQTGTLVDAIEMEEESTQRGETVVTVGVNAEKAPHAPHVIFGTARMVARDFVTGTLQECKPEIEKILKNGITEVRETVVVK